MWVILINRFILLARVTPHFFYKENHITRVYVLPEFEGKGYGTYILNKLEKEIARKYQLVNLDASLPALNFTKKEGTEQSGIKR